MDLSSYKWYWFLPSKPETGIDPIIGLTEVLLSSHQRNLAMSGLAVVTAWLWLDRAMMMAWQKTFKFRQWAQPTHYI